MLLRDVESLKNPAAHTSHLGSAVALPLVLVYLPAGHLVWAVQKSFFVPALDAVSLKNPGAQVSHRGSAMAVMLMYLPGGHVKFWALVQASVFVLLFEANALKNPVSHASHCGCTVVEPAVFVYLPGGHLVCGVHLLLRQPIFVCQLHIVHECRQCVNSHKQLTRSSGALV